MSAKAAALRGIVQPVMSDGKVYPTIVPRGRGGDQSSGSVMVGFSVGITASVGPGAAGVTGVLVGVLVDVEVAVTVEV
jgi:hypothetical protein